MTAGYERQINNGVLIFRLIMILCKVIWITFNNPGMTLVIFFLPNKLCKEFSEAKLVKVLFHEDESAQMYPVFVLNKDFFAVF